MMDDLREDLRAYFDALAVQIERPATVGADRACQPESARRRVRVAIIAAWRRQPVRSALIAFAVIVLGTSAIAMTVRVLGGSEGADSESSQRPPSSGVPQCNGGSAVPCDPGDGNLQLTEKVVVGEGDHQGLHWQILAYESEAGLCVDLRLGQTSGGGCGFDLTTMPVALGTTSGAGYGTWLSGPVRKDVARIAIELTDGQPLEVTPVGSGAGFAVNFFAVPLSGGATVTQVISFDAAGTEIARQQIPPHRVTPPPTAAPPTPTGSALDSPIEGVTIFKDGQCFDANAKRVPCTELHTREEFASFSQRGTLGPGDPGQGSQTHKCEDLFERYTGAPYDRQDRYTVQYTRAGYNQRFVTRCQISSPTGALQPTTGSARDALR